MMNKVFNQRTAKVASVFLVFAVLLFNFQNCSKGEYQFEDSMVSQKLNYFEYRYDKATPIYYDVVMVLEQQDATNKLYKFYVFATPSDNSVTAMDYEVRVYNANNVEVCPATIGTLQSTETSMDYQCITSNTASITSIELKVKKSTDGAWNVYKKSYGSGI